MRISDWSSDVCSSDLEGGAGRLRAGAPDAQDVRGGFEPEAREVGCGQLRALEPEAALAVDLPFAFRQAGHHALPPRRAPRAPPSGRPGFFAESAVSRWQTGRASGRERVG